jgi:hypothetical protein
MTGERAGMCFLEFFAANIGNAHTRRAYARAAEEFRLIAIRPNQPIPEPHLMKTKQVSR